MLSSEFHVKKIKEPKDGGHPILKPIYGDILSAINYIHYSASFKLTKDKRNKTIKSAKELSKDHFVHIDTYTLWYLSKHHIVLEPRYCSCAYGDIYFYIKNKFFV